MATVVFGLAILVSVGTSALYRAYEVEVMLWLVDAVLKPDHEWNESRLATAPDYHDERSWAALPNRSDSADSFVYHSDAERGAYSSADPQAALADAFYVAPTGWYSAREWNADPFEPWFVHLKDAGMTPQQATSLNGVARVYSPRIREMAAYNYFLTSKPEQRALAFDIAYSDLQRAFLHYQRHWSGDQTRPIILLGHSQGTELLLKLIEDHFAPGSVNRRRLVVAYLIGFPVYGRVPGVDDDALDVCRTAEQTSCFVSWRTFGAGGDTSLFLNADDMLFGHSRQNDPARWKHKRLPVCVNPLSWQAGDEGLPIDRSANVGAMALIQPKIDFHRFMRAGAFSYAVDEDWADASKTYELVTNVDIWPTGGLTELEPHLVGAWCNGGALWFDEADLPWFWSAPLWQIAKFPGRNYHAYDINFYWLNIRENVALRLAAFEQQQR